MVQQGDVGLLEQAQRGRQNERLPNVAVDLQPVDENTCQCGDLLLERGLRRRLQDTVEQLEPGVVVRTAQVEDAETRVEDLGGGDQLTDLLGLPSTEGRPSTPTGLDDQR
ncbi:hypothetical protein [Modestobacter sp. KNN46-3]|uniref:hypothetical protein n=1 Tax=Modestobacter sp. KNN46-3 TaxID=2711218 RepID=UPI0013DEFD54|nr:hypothetical protein [Modestobacter sp. KNN46-3]